MHLVNKMGKPDATDERFVDVFDGGKLLTRWAAALFDGSQAIKSSSLVCACNAVAARVRMAAKSSLTVVIISAVHAMHGSRSCQMQGQAVYFLHRLMGNLSAGVTCGS